MRRFRIICPLANRRPPRRRETRQFLHCLRVCPTAFADKTISNVSPTAERGGDWKVYPFWTQEPPHRQEERGWRGKEKDEDEPTHSIGSAARSLKTHACVRIFSPIGDTE